MTHSPSRPSPSASPYISKLDLVRGKVEMIHGAGGKASSQLIDQLFLPAFDNPLLNQHSDQARMAMPKGQLVMATDSHVITPLFFPGGDIGSLAVHGTVNDVTLSGARPLYLSAGFILEEGFPLADLKVIVDSMAAAAREAGVSIITGDTKVVERNKADGVFINTTGIGVVAEDIDMRIDRIQPGDKILINGHMGDHGVCILSKRANLGFDSDIQSDSAALNGLVATMMTHSEHLHYMRDPTRGGVSAILNEISWQRGLGIQLEEDQLPIREQVRSACELLGLDPLYVANEGKLVAFCAPEHAEDILATMRQHPQGVDAAIIGVVSEDPRPFVQLTTAFGGQRMVDWINGEQLPRIC